MTAGGANAGIVERTRLRLSRGIGRVIGQSRQSVGASNNAGDPPSPRPSPPLFAVFDASVPDILRISARRRTPPRMPWRSRLVQLAALAPLGAFALAAVLAVGCRRHPPEGTTVTAAVVDPDAGEVVALAMPDGGAEAGAAGPTIYALGLITPIMNEPEWAPHDPTKASDDRKGVIRLGYLRKGDKAVVKPQIVKKSSCLEGWYELLPPPGSAKGATGGFVCGKYATLDPDDKELANAPHPPNMAGPLPYDYGLNLVNGAPLYRRPPLRKERAEYERGLAVGKTKKDDDTGGATTPAAAAHPPSDNGSGETPWYLEHKDRSQISMDELKGETSLIDKRMVKGFYLALDAKIHAFAGSFWRTTRGMYVPKDHILVHDPKVEFEGVWVGHEGETRHLPLGWVTNVHQWKYTIDDDHQKVHRHDHVDRFTIVQLTGKKVTVENRRYYETDEGWWLRDIDCTITEPGPPPKDLAPGEKWIDVNLDPAVARRLRGRQARLRDDHLERSPRRQQPGEGSPDARGRLPHPREAHLRHDGQRHRDRRAVLDRGRPLDHVLRREHRASRRVLALEVRSREEPRLREHDAARCARALRLGRPRAPRRLARCPRDGGEPGDAGDRPRRGGEGREGEARRAPRERGAGLAPYGCSPLHAFTSASFFGLSTLS